jgi:hypothetical protein
MRFNWSHRFFGVGKMRGVGWAICYENLPKQLKPIEENSFGKTHAMECAPQGATIKEESHGQIRKEGWQKS